MARRILHSAWQSAQGLLSCNHAPDLSLVLLLCLACTVLLSSGCGRRETPVHAGIRDQVLLLGNGSEPRDLDPHIVVSYNDFNIVVALFEGLTGIDEVTSLPIPAAAERWETSSDGLVWRFHSEAAPAGATVIP